MKAIILIVVVFLAGCEIERKTPRFSYGDIVYTVIGNHKGQVVGWVSCNQNTCFYSVRFSSTELTTDTHLFSPDGPITVSPLMLVHHIRDYELK